MSLERHARPRNAMLKSRPCAPELACGRNSVGVVLVQREAGRKP